MNNKWLCFFTLIFISIHSFAQESRDIDYIRTHALLAVEEMHLYKIPASITLAQGILETGGGQSKLAEKANNHFGIKCKKEWTGPVISHTDDAPNECFRAYSSVQESYRDHSKFLAERPFYKNLFKLKLHDYKGWAHGLKKAGYATNPKYGHILISRIEKYNLHEFDKLKPHEVETKLHELYGFSNITPLTSTPKIIEEIEEIIVYNSQPQKEVTLNIEQASETPPSKTVELPKKISNPAMRLKKHANGIHYFIAEEGDEFTKLANYFDISPNELASYNELPVDGKITPGQYIFLGKKKNRGTQSYYKVQEGDNMYLIAQKTGMRISSLYNLNKLTVGDQPKVGTVLNLKKKKK